MIIGYDHRRSQVNIHDRQQTNTRLYGIMIPDQQPIDIRIAWLLWCGTRCLGYCCAHWVYCDGTGRTTVMLS